MELGSVGRASTRKGTITAMSITEAHRKEAIAAALAESQHEQPFEIKGSQEYLPVVSIDIEVPLLSHSTMRVEPTLEELQEWQDGLAERPWSKEAQDVIARCVKGGGDLDTYNELKKSLAKGQKRPGLMTSEGVMLQGNTRLIALRELAEEAGGVQTISVAVVDEKKYGEKALRLLDWEEQHREEIKRPYALTHQLIAIHKARHESKRQPEQIAETMNLPQAEVEKRLLAYQVFDAMRNLPKTTIKVERFNQFGRQNKLALEAIMALGVKWDALVRAKQEEEAEALLYNWLLASMVGGETTGDLREIGPKWADEFLLPGILPDADESSEDGEAVDPTTIALQKIVENAIEANSAAASASDDPLDVVPQNSEGQAAVRVLVDIFADNEATISVPGFDHAVVKQDDLRAVTDSRVGDAIARAKEERKLDNALHAPIKHLEEIEEHLKKAEKALQRARKDSEFHTTKGAYESHLKRLKRRLNAFSDNVDAAFKEDGASQA